MTVWRLKKGSDRRIRGGHPWVFSNELSESPKGLSPGELVELRDHQGSFLAVGYGNPHSLIAFRALSWESGSPLQFDQSFLVNKLIEAWERRARYNICGSFRLCFAENDCLPGLIVDYYVLMNPATKTHIGQVFAIQRSTAGMERLIVDLNELFQEVVAKGIERGLTEIPFEKTGIIERSDVGIRKMEGLDVPEPRIIRNMEGMTWNEAYIAVAGVQKFSDELLLFKCDLFSGQKTGFFLDQTYNISLIADLLARRRKGLKKKQLVRILDLCCYVGHWSVQLNQVFKSHDLEIEITLVDVSTAALQFAKENIFLNCQKIGTEANQVRVQVEQADVLKDLDRLPSNHYDIVIADPPAFIKAKKDIPTGTHAYLKLNTHAYRLVKTSGIVVSCSCSGLLKEEEFAEVIRKAQIRNRQQAWGLVRGGHALDHSTTLQFPEGQYLKMFAYGLS